MAPDARTPERPETALALPHCLALTSRPSLPIDGGGVRENLLARAAR